MSPDVPGMATFGFMSIKTGVAPVTVNIKGTLVVHPPSWICTPLPPRGVLDDVPKVAVAEVGLFTTTLVTATPNSTLTVKSDMKFVPVRVTAAELPRWTKFGEILVSVGGAAMVKVTGLVVPPAELTVMSRGPIGAPLATISDAMIVVGLVTVGGATKVIPVPTLMVAGVEKFVPVSV